MPSEILENISLYCVTILDNFRLLFKIRSSKTRGSGTSLLPRRSLQKLVRLKQIVSSLTRDQVRWMRVRNRSAMIVTTQSSHLTKCESFKRPLLRSFNLYLVIHPWLNSFWSSDLEYHIQCKSSRAKFFVMKICRSLLFFSWVGTQYWVLFQSAWRVFDWSEGEGDLITRTVRHLVWAFYWTEFEDTGVIWNFVWPN